MHWFGEQSAPERQVLSQVVLSIQRSFAVVPLVLFTSSRRIMGRLVNPRWLTRTAWAATLLIVVLNLWLLGQTLVAAMG